MLSIAVYFYYARHDSRRLEVIRRLPRAVVLQAKIDATFLNGLHRVAPTVVVPGKLVTAAFDGDGLSFWTGSTRPERALSIANRDVLAVSAGESLAAASSRSEPAGRVKVVVQSDFGPIAIMFAVEQVVAFGGVGSTMNGRQAVEAAHQANDALGGRRGSTSRTVIQVPGSVDYRLPGVTAWQLVTTLQRRARLYLAVFFIGFFVAMYFVVTLHLGTVPVLALVAIMVVGYVAILVAQRRVKAAKARERGAGYTTLNTESFDLSQLHPRTGFVVRAPGALPLSKAEFARLLDTAGGDPTASRG